MSSTGRNLATNSKAMDITPAKAMRNVGRYNGNEQLVERADGFTEVVTNGTWRGIGMYLNETLPQVGESYTFSANVRNDSDTAQGVSIFMMCFNSSGTRVYPPFNAYWHDTTGGNPSIPPGGEKRIAYTFTWSQEAIDLLAAGGGIRCTMQVANSEPRAFWAPKLEYGTTATPWRAAPEDTEQPSDLVYASEGVDLGDTSGLASDADAQRYASDAQAAATAAAAADATSKAGAAQAAAISAAAADATSKANAAQAAAEATASADATRKAGAAETAAKGYADAQVATRARTFATGWEYRQTADTAVVDGKTYYTRSGTDPDWEWTAVENPVDADIATYWELLPERPVPPYDPGDVWLQGDGGAILACTAAKASGESFSEDDWTLASGYTDDAAAAVLEGGIEALRQADTALSGRIDSAAEASRNAIAALDGRVAAAEGSISGVSGRLVSLEDYVRVVGGDHLELGKAGSSVTASLENDRLAFLLLGQDAPVAYIAADEDGTGKLFVTQAVVVSELQFGHGKWAWTERKNGNMALKWRGGEA